MATINLDVLAIEFNFVDPLGIHVEVDLEVPHEIPKVGGKKIHLGGTTFSLANPNVSLGVNVEVFKGQLDFSLVTSSCTFTIAGKIEVDIEIYKHKWHIGPATVRYTTPLTSMFSFSSTPLFNSLSSAQDKITNAPANKQGRAKPVSTDESDTALKMLTDFMTFAGVSDLETVVQDFLNDFMAKQTFLPAAPVANKLADLSGGARNAVVLLAFGLAASGGGLVGLGAGAGFYVTTKNEGKDLAIGVYGGGAFSTGILAAVSAGFTYTVYWPDGDNSPIDNFKGYNDYASADADVGLGAGVTIYWPANSSFTAQSGVPCGLTVFGGVGVGLPFDIFVGGSATALSPPLTLAKTESVA